MEVFLYEVSFLIKLGQKYSDDNVLWPINGLVLGLTLGLALGCDGFWMGSR